MKNVMKFGAYEAVISFDPDISMFRGEFVGLNGGADFYADSIAKLRKEGETSLRVFLDFAKEKNIEPKKRFSGQFVLRLTPDVHRKYALLAKSRNMSLNQVLATTLEMAAEAVD
ncbi:MAG TPA: type II toxin-antitoxin system HicB family antitoxin [Pyrinomonadaceae bacterium]|nr:type II toxin-antitoxin system HicB family antitoxin [Pyrinomonadaceae bacterium]